MSVADGAATAVKIVGSGMTPTAYAGWSAVIIQLGIVAALIIRNGPTWLDKFMAGRRQDADIEETRRAAQAAEKAAEETRKAAEKMAVNERIDQLEERMVRMGQAISFLMNAAITASNALEIAVPGSPAVKQSRDLIALAASSIGQDDPFSKALSQLAAVKGVGE